jgi:hypothetical protein
MNTLRNPLIWITCLVMLTLAAAFAQDLPPLPPGDVALPPESAAVPPWAQVFAVVMAFLVAAVALARVIVMFTPTNKDNEFVEKAVAVLKKIGLHISIIIFAATLAFTPGCSLLSPKSSVTWEASRFRSFQTTWVATLAVYDHHMDRRVAGKVSDKDAADIDAAWNTFRLAFRVALAEARGDESAFTPDNVKQFSDDLLTLIYASQ